MYTLNQIEIVAALIHNEAIDNDSSKMRMNVITKIYLSIISSGHKQVEKETLASEEIKMIDYYLNK